MTADPELFGGSWTPVARTDINDDHIVNRNVRGSLFADYVRMLRLRKDVDWSLHLTPAELSFMVQRVDPASWYPMESFERMGLAMLGEITKGELEPVRMWGRASVDGLMQIHSNLVVPGDTRETLMRFQVLRSGFFDYPCVELKELSDEHATVRVNFGMSAPAEEAATWQTMGFFDRVIELSGARSPCVYLSAKSWAGDPDTLLSMRWE